MEHASHDRMSESELIRMRREFADQRAADPLGARRADLTGDPYMDSFYDKSELRAMPGTRGLTGTELGLHTWDVQRAAEIQSEMRAAQRARDDERFNALLDYLGETR